MMMMMTRNRINKTINYRKLTLHEHDDDDDDDDQEQNK